MISPMNVASASIANLLFLIGNIMLYDCLSQMYGRYSLMRRIMKRKVHAFLILFISILVLELIAHWVLKLWYFPYFNTLTYILIEIPLLVIYGVYILETYYGTRALLKKFLRFENQNVIIFLTGVYSAIIYELFNLPVGLWRYSNVPFDTMTVFSIPLLVILLWPIQYYALLAIWPKSLSPQ